MPKKGTPEMSRTNVAGSEMQLNAARLDGKMETKKKVRTKDAKDTDSTKTAMAAAQPRAEQKQEQPNGARPVREPPCVSYCSLLMPPFSSRTPRGPLGTPGPEVRETQ